MAVWSFPNLQAYETFVAENPIIPGTETGSPYILAGTVNEERAIPSVYEDGTVRQSAPLDVLQVAWLDSRGVTVVEL